MKTIRKFLLPTLAVLLSVTVLFNGCVTKNEDTIKIGAILPLTNHYADAGRTVQAGLSIAIDELNEIQNSQKYTLIVEDTQSENRNVISAYNKLKNRDRANIIFTTTSEHSLALKPRILKDGSTMLFAIASHPEILSDNNGLIFRPNNTSIEESLIISNHILNKKESQSVVVFYFNSEFGVSFQDQISNQLTDYGVNVSSIAFDQRTDQLRALLTNEIINNQVSTAVVIGFSPTMGSLIKVLRENNFKGDIISNTGFYNRSVISAAGDAANGVKYVEHNFPYDKNPGFDSIANNRFKVDFSALSYIAYFSVKAINMAAEKTTDDVHSVSEYLRNANVITIDDVKIKANKDGSLLPELFIKTHRIEK